MNSFRLTCASMLCLFTCAAAANAAQFTMTADIYDGASLGTTYIGSDLAAG